MSKTLKLNNGYEIPSIGLGTYKSRPGELEQAIKDAIDAGYRHFDCAWIYGNEAEVGAGIKAKIDEGVIKREELFISSKLWNNFHDKKNVVPKLKESLSSFGLNYLDLFLMHWPYGFKETADVFPANGCKSYSDVDYLETWQGMEECVDLGLAKTIGVSNFNEEQLQRLMMNCKIKPAVNQIEVNPNLNQKDLRCFCRQNDIVVVGYCPLGRSNLSGTPGYPESSILDPKVIEIGKKHNKSPAQVVLNYLISLGIGVIPKSTTKSRIMENIDVYNFELDPEDVEYLNSCNKNVRLCPSTNYKDHKYFPFEL